MKFTSYELPSHQGNCYLIEVGILGGCLLIWASFSKPGSRFNIWVNSRMSLYKTEIWFQQQRWYDVLLVTKLHNEPILRAQQNNLLLHHKQITKENRAAKSQCVRFNFNWYGNVPGKLKEDYLYPPVEINA